MTTRLVLYYIRLLRGSERTLALGTARGADVRAGMAAPKEAVKPKVKSPPKRAAAEEPAEKCALPHRAQWPSRVDSHL